MGQTDLDHGPTIGEWFAHRLRTVGHRMAIGWRTFFWTTRIVFDYRAGLHRKESHRMENKVEGKPLPA